jgi:hypothetical protein
VHVALACAMAWGYGRALDAGVRGVHAAAAVGTAAPFLLAPRAPVPRPSPCPDNMQLIDRGSGRGSYCIDRYEASTEEMLADGRFKPHSPYESVKGLHVRAISRPHVVPQAYISKNEAEIACSEAHKRLCSDDEWVHACRGTRSTRYPYGNERRANVCVDTHRVSPLERLFGQSPGRYYPQPMNDPRLNQIPGTLAPTGTFSSCTNDFRVYDMVGNVHEWTADPAGTFRGGYYLDTKINGEGCEYRTVAHGPGYHDYSTGFRCCAEPATSAAP